MTLSFCYHVWWSGMSMDQVDKAGSLCQTPTSCKIQIKFYFKCNNQDLQGQDTSHSVSIPLSTNPQTSLLPPTARKGPNATRSLHLWNFRLDCEYEKKSQVNKLLKFPTTIHKSAMSPEFLQWLSCCCDCWPCSLVSQNRDGQPHLWTPPQSLWRCGTGPTSSPSLQVREKTRVVGSQHSRMRASALQ